jgi:hypothetical protein
VEALEGELAKARKHSAMLQSKLDGAFAQYHNEVQDMQAKSDELVRSQVASQQEQMYAAVLSSTHWKYLAVV